MKHHLHSLLAAAWLPLHAGEAPAEAPSPVPSEPSAPAVRIVGPLPDGAPPPPAPPRPRLVFEADDVLASRTRDLGQRQITFQKVAPLSLPPLPQAPQPPDPEDPAWRDLAEERRELHKDRRFVFIGASAYISRDAPDRPLSYVRVWPHPKAEPFGLWINSNFLWLGGFAGYDTDESSYALFLATSRVDLDHRAQAAVFAGREYLAPALPDFPAGEKTSFIVAEGSPTEEELRPVRALLELYDSDRERLRLAFESRMAAAEARERERRENPPERKNLTIRYWRLDAAGQAGTQTKPATIR